MSTWKRWRKVCLSAVLLLLTAAAGLVVASRVAVSQYWQTGHLPDLQINMGAYSTYLEASGGAQDSTKQAIRSSYESAVPVSAECTAFFEECNGLICDFFQDEYGISVADTLSRLRVMRAEFPGEAADSVGGSYAAGTLYLNAVLMDSFLEDAAGEELAGSGNESFSRKLLRNVYIHETIHYLGFSGEPQFGRFIEAITEALTEMVLEHGGTAYESLTGYQAIQDFAYQMVDADPTLVENVLSAPNNKLADRFGGVLGADYVTIFDDLLFILQTGGARQYPEVPYLAQYIAYEYVKCVSDTGEYSRFRDRSAVSHFELKWWAGIYR